MIKCPLKYWLIAWHVVSMPSGLKAQESEFRWFVSEQVVTSRWMPVEGEVILQYIERNGPPIIPEEASAIVGLSVATRQELYRSKEWLAFCTGKNASTMRKRARSKVEVRTDGNVASSRNSIRIKNPGKWAFRMDGPWAGRAHERRVTGYLQLRPSRNFELVIGTHKVGWANRLVLSEAVFFSGALSPAFAVPVHYAFAPFWGDAASGLRSGIACKVKRPNWELSLSADRILSHSRWAVSAFRRLQNGAVGCVLERGWVLDAGMATHISSWAGSAFAFGNQRGWQWSVECAPNISSQSLDGTWLRSVGRGWDGFGMLNASRGWVPNHERMQRQWQENASVSIGMQWSSKGGHWRSRFQIEMKSMTSRGVESVIRSNAIRHISDEHQIELHARWQGESTTFDRQSNRTRLGFRWRFSDAFSTGNFRVEWCPNRRGHGVGWSCIWSVIIGRIDVKVSISDWAMGSNQVGYFVVPAFDGIRLQGMHQHGSRASFRLSRKIRDDWKIQILGFKANANDSEEYLSGLSTVGYAQSEIQIRLMLNL